MKIFFNIIKNHFHISNIFIIIISIIFSVCGDYRVEGDEECDCGMSYETCSDPCCYAAHISPRDLSWNVSAVPCRRHRSPVCLKPFRGLLTFGVVMPWCFIGK